MVGIVDAGGGMRGIYGAAVFDWCLEQKIGFDYLIGVSAGSANCAAFLAQQHGRNIRFYVKYNYRWQYMSWKSFFRTGNYLNLEYIYGDGLSNSCGEYPLDYETMIQSEAKFRIVATDAATGQPVYYDMHEMARDDYGAIKGSSCVPLAAKAYHWKGRDLYDGGLSDPLPYRKAFEAGCDKVILIMTRPKTYRRDPDGDRKFAFMLKWKYPEAAKALLRRGELYNRQLEEALRLEKEGKLLILAPDDITGLDTLTKDREKLKKLYKKGRKDAHALKDFLKTQEVSD